MNEHVLPQMEQLQTRLQASSDERIRLEDDLQRNKEMVSLSAGPGAGMSGLILDVMCCRLQRLKAFETLLSCSSRRRRKELLKLRD